MPGLCGPLPELQALKQDSSVSALLRLLARADKTMVDASDFHSQLAMLFGLDLALAMPIAALTLLGYEHDLNLDGHTEAVWLHVDPVHLRVDMDHAILLDRQSLHLGQAEVDALLKELNQHFSADGLTLFAKDIDHWFMSIEDSGFKTTPLPDVIGRNVNFFLPYGPDAGVWKKFMTEAQMLLHMSDVNVQRQAQGMLPVNSLWLWGEGRHPAVHMTQVPVTQISGSQIDCVISDQALCKGLAIASDINHDQLPQHVHGLSPVLERTRHPLVVLDDLLGPACYGDIDAWKAKFEKLFTTWVEPLITETINHGGSVNLYPCNGVRYTMTSRMKYRFWRSSNINQYIDTYAAP